mmetsp:Transcript_42829/g.58475  ORF Transcript_42829/g.58475 Transcript_42829/m.58475 type:complete len:84 (+) Transcript_42829:61-312(+)
MCQMKSQAESQNSLDVILGSKKLPILSLPFFPQISASYRSINGAQPEEKTVEEPSPTDKHLVPVCLSLPRNQCGLHIISNSSL